MMNTHALYTLTLFTSAQGDVTIGWSDEQVDMMTEVIARKMQEGYTFFIIADDGREVRLRGISELAQCRAVTIGDKEAEQLIREGKIGIVDVSAMVEPDDGALEAPDAAVGADDASQRDKAPATTRAKSARQVATARSVGVQAMAAG